MNGSNNEEKKNGEIKRECVADRYLREEKWVNGWNKWMNAKKERITTNKQAN